MTTKMEQLKQRMKEEYEKKADEYFSKYEELKNSGKFNIDGIEMLLGDGIAATKEVLIETIEEMIKQEMSAETNGESKKKTCSCGKTLRLWDKRREITITTMHGNITYGRPYWYCRDCGYGEFPDDAVYGIDGLGHRLTRAVKLEAVYFAQNQMSFDRAEEVIKRVYKIEVNRETIREIAEDAGTKVFVNDSSQAQALLADIAHIEADKKVTGTVYIMPDGAAVNTRVEDENGSTWRENKTAIAFSSKDMIKRKDGGNIIVRKEIAPLIGTSEEFKKHALRAAVAAGYGKFTDTVVIADGAAWIRNMCDDIFPDAVQILDLFHLKENIYTFSKYLSKDIAQVVRWAENVIDKIENHYAVDEALDCIPVTENLPDGVPNLRTYIENNRTRMNYPMFRERGYFVGSGAIESTNKTIVQQRLKRAGMRWSVDGAQALLSLRAKDESKKWFEVEKALA